MATHSSILAWEIPWTEEPVRLQSMGLPRVRHNLASEHALILYLKVAAAAAAKLLQSCPTLSNPMDCSLPGLSVHGIFQARVVEWGAIAFSNLKVDHVIQLVGHPAGITELHRCVGMLELVPRPLPTKHYFVSALSN